jgi:hypothetical protein
MEVKEELQASDEDMQVGVSILAQLSDLELQELADKNLSYNDLVENIKSRELLLIWAHLKAKEVQYSLMAIYYLI